jgi:hypothetical protein
MLAALRFLILLPVSALALDLKPTPDFKELEGVKIPVLRFEDPGKRVTWRPPASWRMSFEQGVLSFVPTGLTHASFEMMVIPRKPQDNEPLSKPASLQEYVAALLPKSATNITYKGGNEGPFTINGIPAREFLFEFQEPSHATQASLSVVDLNERERLLVVITAQPKDFDQTRATTIQSMFSWQVE